MIALCGYVKLVVGVVAQCAMMKSQKRACSARGNMVLWYTNELITVPYMLHIRYLVRRNSIES